MVRVEEEEEEETTQPGGKRQRAVRRGAGCGNQLHLDRKAVVRVEQPVRGLEGGCHRSSYVMVLSVPNQPSA
jgi:hypothetical protein